MTERILSVSTIIFAAFFLTVSLQIESRGDSTIGPSSWPSALMAMMLVLGILLTFNVFRKNNKHNSTSEDENLVTEEKIVTDDEEELVYPSKFYYMLLLLIVYIICLYFIGFILSTLILITTATLLFGMKKWRNRLITAIASTAGFIVLFPILLSLPFPRGVGIFREISLLFY